MQRCRNNKGAGRGRHTISNCMKKSGRFVEAGEKGEEGEKEETNGKIVTRELKQRERGTLSVRPYVGPRTARISHLHRNKLAGTIGSSVHSDTANT